MGAYLVDDGVLVRHPVFHTEELRPLRQRVVSSAVSSDSNVFS